METTLLDTTIFETRFPGVVLEVHCGLSVGLVGKVRSDELDLAITTRQPNSPGGEVLCREATVWGSAPGHDTPHRRPLPLAVSRDGICIFKERTITALDAASINWGIAYTSASLSGLTAAVKAGLAITILTPSMVGTELRILGRREGLPELPQTEIALHRNPGRPNESSWQLAMRLQAHIKGSSAFQHQIPP